MVTTRATALIGAGIPNDIAVELARAVVNAKMMHALLRAEQGSHDETSFQAIWALMETLLQQTAETSGQQGSVVDPVLLLCCYSGYGCCGSQLYRVISGIKRRALLGETIRPLPRAARHCYLTINELHPQIKFPEGKTVLGIH